MLIFFSIQSITMCVNTCTKPNPIPNTETTAWCLVVSNPNTGLISLKISYAFGSASPSGAAGTNSTTNGVSSPTLTGDGAGASPSNSNNGGVTTTVTFPSGVEK